MKSLLLGCSLAVLAACASAPPATPRPWVATWVTSPQAPEVPPCFDDRTLRMVVHSTFGGPAARVRLTNRYGRAPVTIGDARLAIVAAGAAIRP